jgi:bifunctional DNA-binding transcriptional regulator/antitoxin component of YhaV-PrlF toxin-antitoxin module
MGVRFSTTVLQAEGLNATGLRIPADVIAALGTQKRPKVKVTVNGYTYRSTVAAYGDVFMLPLSQENREAAGVKAGDPVEVTLELDLEPRIVEVPEDLRAALSGRAGAMQAFEALSFTKRKEFVRQVEEAKTQETRSRRISKIAAELEKS